MSFRVSLRGMLRLIRVDTLRSVHNIGLLVGRLNFKLTCLTQKKACLHVSYHISCRLVLVIDCYVCVCFSKQIAADLFVCVKRSTNGIRPK